jgi:hypothetical protein
MSKHGYGAPTTVGGVSANERHVSASEAADAATAVVGDGTPETAPEVLPGRDSWRPTRKWLAATIGEAGTVVSAILISAPDEVTKAEWVVVVGLLVTRAVAYVLQNDSTPGGIPEA